MGEAGSLKLALGSIANARQRINALRAAHRLAHKVAVLLCRAHGGVGSESER